MAPSNSSNFLVIEDPYFEVSKEVRRIKAGAQALSLYSNVGDGTGGSVPSSGESQGCGPKEE